MDTTTKIIHSLTRIQECTGLLKHTQDGDFDGINLAEVHCIDHIGSMEYANVTKVANEMNMTRGAVSKISRKLLSKGFIESFQRNENKKEIYFQLTTSGARIYDAHKKCHAHALKEKIAILSNYTEEEQAVILNFLSDMNRWFDSRLAHDALCEESHTTCGR